MPNNSSRILLVEDNLPDALYTKELLPDSDYTFHDARTLAEAVACVQAQNFDVILLDLSLPDSHGIETLEKLLNICSIPVVVLTGLEDIEMAVQVLKVGASDYIVKNNLTPEALARSISYAIESAKRKLIEERLVKAEQRLRLALEGSQTGTWVRVFESDQFLCDRQARKLFGLEETANEQLSFADFLKLVHPADQHIAIQSVAKNVAEMENEYRVIWSDKTVHWISCRGKTTSDSSGRPLQAAGVCIDVTARKQSEKERSELAAIVASADAGIISQTLDGLVTSWNQASERIYGYSAAEMLGRTMSILLTESALTETAAIEKRVAEGECVDQYESQRTRKDGAIIDCAFTISALKNEQNNIIGFSIIVRDITLRKRAEKLHSVQNEVTILLLEATSLEEAAPRVLKLVADVLNWSVGQLWQVDQVNGLLHKIGMWNEPNGNYRDFASISKHLTFAEGQDLIGRVWLNRMPEWLNDLSDPAIFSRSLIATKTNLHYGCAFPIVKDNVLAVIEFFSTGPPNIGLDGQAMLDSVCAQLWQFMNRKLDEETIERSLHAQRTIAQAILENAPIGIAKLDKNFQFTEVNSAFSQQFHMPSHSLAGRSIFQVTTGLPLDEILKVISDGSTLRTENVKLVFEGVPNDLCVKERCWDLAAWPIRDSAGEVAGLILITADATERAQLSRQREDFVATLTHDLKNPLIGQNRIFQLFLAGTLGPLAEKHLEIVTLLKDSTVEMLDLIGNLLESYRYDAGAQHLQLENFGAKDLLDSCIVQTRAFAETKNIKLNSSVDDTLLLFADRTSIRRVVMNLLDNATKFARPGTVIDIWSENTSEHCVLRFKDRGDGIQKNYLPLLFQRFSQTEAGRSANASTGLGLYLCKQIVEGHGGTISCESEIGEGSVFSVSLPLVKTSARTR